MQSTIDAAKLVSSGVDDEAMLHGGKRPRVGAGGLDAMAAMEAEAMEAEAAAAPKVRLSWMDGRWLTLINITPA